MLRPPADVEPADLFLTLIEWPAPRRPIAFTFGGPEAGADLSAALWVRAVSPHVWDVARRRESRSEILASALCSEDGEPVFRDARQVARALERTEMERLWSHVSPMLDRISPHYSRIDHVRWHAALEQGARECLSIAHLLGSSIDVAVGMGGVVRKPRPDLYWGCALRELLDGHRMAFDAAFDVVNPHVR